MSLTAAERVAGPVVQGLHPSFGAEINGIDLRAPLDDATFELVRDAFHHHSVLLFRRQFVTDAQQVAFSRRFGALEANSFVSIGSNKHPNVYELSNVGEHGQVMPRDASRMPMLRVNERWHTDSSFKAIPALGSILSARDVPEVGGDTCYVSMRVAYETLSDELTDRIHGCVGVHDFNYSMSFVGRSGVSKDELDGLPPVQHPLVRTHAPTGRKSLYISGHIREVVGMPVEEGRALVQELMDWATRPDCVYRHKWRNGDILMWDNRCVLHRATGIPESEPRIMHRTTIAGEGPVV